jgi:cupin 2 domain-containing protein
MSHHGNLFESAEPPHAGERFESLTKSGGLEVERILSSGDVPSADYLQPHDEWVVLLRGSARLTVRGVEHRLRPGDWHWLPAGTPHSVAETTEGAVWLAVHHRSDSE